MSDLTRSLDRLNGARDYLARMRQAYDAGGAAMLAIQAEVETLIQKTAIQVESPSTFGEFSSIDQLLRAERFAGKAGCIDFVKANPTCKEKDAIEAWSAAAIAATKLPAPIQDAAILGKLYRSSLAQKGLIPEATWEAQRAWIVAQDKTAILEAS